MSRNLGRIDCRECPGQHVDIVFDEQPRPIAESDCGKYFSEYNGLIVAKAHCRLCHALYLAWVDWPNSGYDWHLSDGCRFVDLSFQNSFNDEPSEIDTPLYVVEAIVTYRRRPALPDEHAYRRGYQGSNAEYAQQSAKGRAAWELRQAAEVAKKLGVMDEGPAK
jgi:hypothetical protein